MADKLIIFDTTLRDGEQSPGASMTKDEKMRIARQLERLKVDVIEAGFAASSRTATSRRSARSQADQGQHRLRAVARQRQGHPARCGRAASRPSRAHPHLPRDRALHMEKKLRMTPEQVFEQAKLAVRYARKFTDDVEFSPEDGSRSDMDFLCRVLEAVIDEGATTINIPDTVGYGVPGAVRRAREDAARASTEFGQGGVVGALPQRPRHGGRQFAGRRADRRRAPGRVHDQRPGRARRQHVARGGRDGGEHAQGFFRSRHRHRYDADRAGLEAGVADHRLRRCSRTRRWSAPMPSRTHRASTRTACSRRATPTKSCAPRMWAGARTRSCSASCRAATPSSSAWRNWASSWIPEAN